MEPAQSAVYQIRVLPTVYDSIPITNSNVVSLQMAANRKPGWHHWNSCSNSLSVWLYLSSSLSLSHAFQDKLCRYFKTLLWERQRFRGWRIEVFPQTNIRFRKRFATETSKVCRRLCHTRQRLREYFKCIALHVDGSLSRPVLIPVLRQNSSIKITGAFRECSVGHRMWARHPEDPFVS